MKPTRVLSLAIVLAAGAGCTSLRDVTTSQERWARSGFVRHGIYSTSESLVLDTDPLRSPTQEEWELVGRTVPGLGFGGTIDQLAADATRQQETGYYVIPKGTAIWVVGLLHLYSMPYSNTYPVGLFLNGPFVGRRFLLGAGIETGEGNELHVANGEIREGVIRSY